MKKNGVVCAIDVNDYDQDVVDLAASFADQYSCDLDLIHVTLFPNPSEAIWPAYLGSSSELVLDNQRLNQIATNVKGVTVNRRHLSGIPEDQVVQFVKRNEPRLLVLGTHGRGGLSRIFGSVATKIMRKVQCPVMVLRQKAQSPVRPAVNTNSI